MKKSSETRPKPALLNYTEARLYDHDGLVGPKVEWYFEYTYLSPYTGNFERHKHRFNINRIKGRDPDDTRKLRYEFAEDIIFGINLWLSLGNSPYKKTLTDKALMTSIMGIDRGLELAIAQTDNIRTQQSYSSLANMFKDWLRLRNYDELDIKEIDFLIIQEFADHLLIDEKLGNKTVNGYIGYLSSFFGKIKKRKIIKENPCAEYENLIEQKGKKNIPLTTAELKILLEKLPDRDPELWTCFLFISYPFLRGKEIMLLQNGSIDYENDLIQVVSVIAKNKSTKVVKMMPEFRDHLIKQGYDKLPGHYYLFSKGLKPGLIPEHRNRLSDRWRDVVKKELGIDKDMYGGRHAAAKSFILNGGSKESLQSQMRHSSVSITEVYLQSILPLENMQKFAREFKQGLLSTI